MTRCAFKNLRKKTHTYDFINLERKQNYLNKSRLKHKYFKAVISNFPFQILFTVMYWPSLFIWQERNCNISEFFSCCF